MGRALFFLMSLMVLLTACGHKKAKDHVIIPTSNFLKLEDEIPILPSWPQQDFLIVQINSEPDNLHPVKGNSSVRSDMFKLIHHRIYSKTKLVINFWPLMSLGAIALICIRKERVAFALRSWPVVDSLKI